ncbi:esterase family protein [Ruminococcaceae bacterium OttesenSCG-928-L11]|nr:esterase family protein [Ruminococcaceae bacterium OttesenSCG-928-L11]
MALASIDFFSHTLGMDTSMTVLLPEKRGQAPTAAPERKYPVLYLLHGHSDDHTSWMRKSLVELLVRNHDLIVVMPAAHRSFYCNSKSGHQYFDFMAQELPVVVENFFPASSRREDRYVAGLSMGGYGAFHLALSRPDRYGAAGSLSGALFPFDAGDSAGANALFPVADFRHNLESVFGPPQQFAGSENDLIHAAARLEAEGGSKPCLYMCCGKQDFLYNINRRFRDAMEQYAPSIPLQYAESDGAHDWDYWNANLPALLTALNIL